MDNDAPIHVLLVEDDERLAALTRQYLEKHGLLVVLEYDGLAGLNAARRGNFDVLLLDIMLPGMSGLEVCQRVRRVSDVPIIMITARGEEADKVMGLEIGADDYVPKPYSPRELLARIRTTVRRARGQLGPSHALLKSGGLEIDTGSRTALLDGELLELTSYEFDLLLVLLQRAGRVLGREQLMELAGGSPEESFDRSIDVHISRLRQKLRDNPKKPRLIKTVRGVGYQFVIGSNE